MNNKTRKVIKEFVVEHFLRKLDLACPRCGKRVVIQFSLEGGPVANYKEEEQTASIKGKTPVYEYQRPSSKEPLVHVKIGLREDPRCAFFESKIPEKFAEKLIEAIKRQEGR